MSLASGGSTEGLDPRASSSALPGYLSTPISALSVLELAYQGDKEALSAYLSYAAYGNYEYCEGISKSSTPAHYCGLSVTNVGPFLGYCLPKACSAEDFKMLAGPCQIARVEAFALEAGALTNDTNINSTTAKAFIKAAYDGIPNQGLDTWSIRLGLLAIDSLTHEQGKGMTAMSGAGGVGLFTTLGSYCDEFDRGLGGEGIFCVVCVCLLLFLFIVASVMDLKAAPKRADLDEDAKSEENCKEAFLDMFSAPRTLVALLSGKPRLMDFPSLHGLKVLTLGYVILGQLLLLGVGLQKTSNAVPALTDFQTSFEATVLLGAFRAVDTFYFISGFLAFYGVIRRVESSLGLKGEFKASGSDMEITVYVDAEHHKNEYLCMARAKDYVALVGGRWLRLTPLYAGVLFVYVTVAPSMMQGPVANGFDKAVALCTHDQTWLFNLFYLNSIFPTDASPDSSCMGWTWYLANDFIFYLFVPPLVWVYVQLRAPPAPKGDGTLAQKSVVEWWGDRYWICMYPFIALGILWVILNGYLSYWSETQGLYPLDPLYAKHLYARPWNRYMPYLVGGVIGLFYYERQKIYGGDLPRAGMTPFKVALYTASGIAMALSTYIIPYCAYMDSKTGVFGPSTWSRGSIMVSNAVISPLYSLGLCGFVQMFCDGSGGFIRDVIAWPGWRVFSQLLYGAFLWSIPLILLHESSVLSVQYVHFGDSIFGKLSWLLIGCFFMSFLLSFVSYCLLERPFTVMRRILFSQPTSYKAEIAEMMEMRKMVESQHEGILNAAASGRLNKPPLPPSMGSGATIASKISASPRSPSSQSAVTINV